MLFCFLENSLVLILKLRSITDTDVLMAETRIGSQLLTPQERLQVVDLKA